MNKLDNYIFYSICERSFELFKDTKFVTFTIFCDSLKASIELGDLSKKELFIMYEIGNYLEKLYDLDFTEKNSYVADFFLKQKVYQFERSVRMMQEYFRNSFN